MHTIEDYSLFICIVEQNSFHQAAEKLKVSASAVSRQLKKLEQKLGVQLLNRTTRSFSLTQAGQIYLDSCYRIEEEKCSTNRQLQDLNAKPLGRLKITVTPTFAQVHLLNLISEFSEKYPDISFQLEVTDKQVDIVEDGIDIAIRIGAIQDSRLKSRLLLKSQLIPCASPSYIQKYGEPNTGKQLSDHQFIYLSHLPSIEKRHQQRVPEMVIHEQQKKLVVNDVLSIYHCVKAGMGISILPEYLVQTDLVNGNLLALFSGRLNTAHEVHLLFQNSTFMPMKTRAFIDFLVARFGSEK